MTFEQLKLENQLCFPLYAASRLMIQEYQPHLEKLGITYPQYLVLMVLWETDSITVHDITHRLILDTNTVTPILKRMEAHGIITRQRSEEDERKVIVALTSKGKQLQLEAATIPEKMIAGLADSNLTVEELERLKDQLYAMIQALSKQAE